jgi:phosphotransferase system enzyme I (PtsP)
MSPASVGPVKAMLLDLDGAAHLEAMDAMLADPLATVSVRDALVAYAQEHGISL